MQSFKTEIKIENREVSPTNIQVINGQSVIVISSGGTQAPIIIPLKDLSRAAAVALSK